MRKCIEGLVSRAAIIYRVYWLICSPRFIRRGRREGGGAGGEQGAGIGSYVERGFREKGRGGKKGYH